MAIKGSKLTSQAEQLFLMPHQILQELVLYLMQEKFVRDYWTQNMSDNKGACEALFHRFGIKLDVKQAHNVKERLFGKPS